MLFGEPIAAAVSVVQPQQARFLCLRAPAPPFMLHDGRGTPHGYSETPARLFVPRS